MIKQTDKNVLPVGKLPAALLAQLLAQAPAQDPHVWQGPGVGLDCAVVEVGDRLLVFKSDPITFATAEIGWYAVQINANDIATTGATPRWFLTTLLLPEGQTTAELVEQISQQIYDACRAINVTVIGGHTEITHGLSRPILLGTMIGEVARERLVTPKGVSVGDRILLTKGVPIEATALLAREFPERLSQALTPAELAQAQAFLHEPGLSVLPDAQIALQAGQVTAMHDPTEGGIAAGLWELAQASGHALCVNLAEVPIPPLAYRICQAFELDPWAAIASGALLLTASADEALRISQALNTARIPCVNFGVVEQGPASVWHLTERGIERLPFPDRDEITKIYEA